MIENISYSYMILNNRKFSGKILVDCDFSNTILNNCDFSNSRLINCNFSGAEINNCKFDNAKIRESEFAFSIRHTARKRMSYCKINKCTFRNAVILYTDFWCIAKNVDFSGAKIGKCNFIASDLTDVDFRLCTIKYIYAEDTNFDNSDFNDFTTENYNFKNCRFINRKVHEIFCQKLHSQVC